MRKWIISQKTSKQWSHQPSHKWWIRLTFINPHKTRRINQSLRILTLWSRLTGVLRHLAVDIIQKLVAYGLSNMISAHQKSMNSLSIQNSKETLLWTSIPSTTTPRCTSMRWLDSEKTFFLPTSLSKYILSLKNTSFHIVVDLPILGVFRFTLPLDTHYWWKWLMTPV